MDTYMHGLLTIQPSYKVESVDWNKSSQQKKKKNTKSFLKTLEEADVEEEEDTTTYSDSNRLGDNKSTTNVVELYQYMAPTLRHVK